MDQRIPLEVFVSHIYPISKATSDYIRDNSHPLVVAKGKHILRAGEICKNLYFIHKGVMRGYIVDNKKQITTWMSIENELVTSIYGFDLQLPSRENIQALEECTLTVASFEHLQYLYEHHPDMNIVGRKVLEKYYRDAEERAYICRLTNAMERYQHFLQMDQGLINRLPLKYIASYLGMTNETLSRIRSKVR